MGALGRQRLAKGKEHRILATRSTTVLTGGTLRTFAQCGKIPRARCRQGHAGHVAGVRDETYAEWEQGGCVG